MKLYKVDITPLSLFRDYPSSYTIFGAISWGYSLLYGQKKLESILNEFINNNPLFLISSILPKKENKYFFPKPNLLANREENPQIDYKRLKKISYVDFEILKKVLDGQIKNELELHKEINKKVENVSLTKKDIIPHVSIDRLYSTVEGSSGLFFEEVVALGEAYFLIAIKDETVKKELENIFNLLQDIGLGGNRSIGYGKVAFGKFEEFNEIEKYFKNKTYKFITLSPIIPETNTYDLLESYYDYYTFRGAIDNNYGFKNVDVWKYDIWKDKVIYLKEGSTLKVKIQKSFYGQFYKAKQLNNIPIYQYGLAFPLYLQGGS